MTDRTLRLDRLLGNFGYCSRKDAAGWLRSGRVDVSGVVVRDPAAKADPALVRVDGEPVPFPRGVLILLHKPLGLVCSHAAAEGPNVFDLLPALLRGRDPRPEAVGRLDRDTSGLLLLTDRGDVLHRLTHPSHETPKTYALTTDAPIPEAAIDLLATGSLQLHGERRPCLPAELRFDAPQAATLTLREGKYHQVRRMMAAVGCRVLTLHRVSVGSLTLGDLPAGGWRPLTPHERVGLLGADPLDDRP